MSKLPVVIGPEDFEALSEEDDLKLHRIVEKINSQIKQTYKKSSNREFIIYPGQDSELAAEACKLFATKWHIEQVVDHREGGFFWRMKRK